MTTAIIPQDAGAPAPLTDIAARARSYITDMTTVRTCGPCNKSKGDDEPYYRDWLLSDSRTQAHPVAEQIRSGPLQRAKSRNQSRLDWDRRVVPFTGKPVTHRTPQGIYFDMIPIPLDEDRIRRVVGIMTRGLFYHVYQQLIPLNHMPTVFHITPEPWMHPYYREHCPCPIILGDGVFEALYFAKEEDPTFTDWLLTFYSNITFSVTT